MSLRPSGRILDYGLEHDKLQNLFVMGIQSSITNNLFTDIYKNQMLKTITNQ